MGIAALARLVTRRRPHEPAPAAIPPVDDRAEALRRKLDETRAAEEASAAPAAAPPALPEAEQDGEPEAVETIEERRARVHAKAQEAIAAMQEPPE